MRNNRQFQSIALTIAVFSAAVGYFITLSATLTGVSEIPALKQDIPEIAIALISLGGALAVYLPYAAGHWSNKEAGRWALGLLVFLGVTLAWKTPLGHFGPIVTAWWWSGIGSLFLGSVGIIAHPRMFPHPVAVSVSLAEEVSAD